MTRWPAALAVAVALVVAGCGGFAGSGGGGSRPTPAETVTPAPVPTAEPTPTTTPRPTVGSEFDPGDPLVSNEAFADRHASRLRATSFTRRTNRTIRADNRTIQAANRTVRIAPGLSSYRMSQAYGGTGEYPVEPADAPRIDLWWGGERMVIRLRVENWTEYVQARSEAGPISDPTRRDRIASLVSAFEPRTVDRRSANGTTRYVLRGTRTPDAVLLNVPALVESPRNVSFRMTVRADGVVLAYRLAYDGTFDGETVRVIHGFRITAVGETPVERPVWATVRLGTTPDEHPRTPRNGSDGRSGTSGPVPWPSG